MPVQESRSITGPQLVRARGLPLWQLRFGCGEDQLGPVNLEPGPKAGESVEARPWQLREMPMLREMRQRCTSAASLGSRVQGILKKIEAIPIDKLLSF